MVSLYLILYKIINLNLNVERHVIYNFINKQLNINNNLVNFIHKQKNL